MKAWTVLQECTCKAFCFSLGSDPGTGGAFGIPDVSVDLAVDLGGRRVSRRYHGLSASYLMT